MRVLFLLSPTGRDCGYHDMEAAEATFFAPPAPVLGAKTNAPPSLSGPSEEATNDIHNTRPLRGACLTINTRT